MLNTLTQRLMIRDVIRSWRLYHDAVLNCFGSETVTGEQEEQFLKLKAKIATRMPEMARAVPQANQVEAKEHLGLMNEVLNRYRSLKAETPMDAKEREQFEAVWHRLFLFLNSLKGMPLASNGRRAGTAFAPTGMRRRHGPRAVPGAALFGFVLRLGFVGLLIYILGRAFGLRWGESGLTAQGPITPQSIGKNTQGAFGAIGHEFTRFMDPVINTYGGTMTIVLVTVLVLALAYWFFVRR